MRSSDRALDAAYRAATYTVVTPAGTIALRVDAHCVELEQLLAAHGAADWAYVTACNPGSVPLAEMANAARHAELSEAVRCAGFTCYEGVGTGEGWSPEPSLLILGISTAEAAEFGRHFGQNAILVGERGGVSRLHWLL